MKKVWRLASNKQRLTITHWKAYDLRTDFHHPIANDVNRFYVLNWFKNLMKENNNVNNKEIEGSISDFTSHKRKRYRKGSEYGKHHQSTYERYQDKRDNVRSVPSYQSSIPQIPPKDINLSDDVYKYPESKSKDTIHDYYRKQHRDSNKSGVPIPENKLEEVTKEAEDVVKDKLGRVPNDTIGTPQKGPVLTSSNSMDEKEMMTQASYNDLVDMLMNMKQQKEELRFTRYAQTKIHSKENFIRTIREHRNTSVWKYYASFSTMLAAMTGAVAVASQSWVWPAGMIAFLGTSFAINSTKFTSGEKVAKHFHGRKCQNARLLGIFHDLVKRAGLSDNPPTLYIVNSEEKNAFAAGRAESDAVVVLTTGLIEVLEEDEIESVMAHELGHIINGDMVISYHVMNIVSSVYLLYRFAMETSRRSSSSSSSSSSKSGSKSNSGGNFVSLLITVASGLGYLSAYLVQAAVSRHREFAADAISVALTGSSRGLHRALTQISNSEIKPKLAHSHIIPETANSPAIYPVAKIKLPSNAVKVDFRDNRFVHMYIHGDPFSLTRYLSTHPPVQNRLMMVLGYEDMMNSKFTPASLASFDSKPFRALIIVTSVYSLSMLLLILVLLSLSQNKQHTSIADSKPESKSEE